MTYNLENTAYTTSTVSTNSTVYRSPLTAYRLLFTFYGFIDSTISPPEEMSNDKRTACSYSVQLMQVIRELTQSLKMDSLVTAAVVGPHLIAVAGRRLGLAANLHGSSDSHTVATINEAENLLEKSACDIAHWLLQEELIKAGIGMAALNSVLEIDHGRLYEMNAKQIIAARATGKNLMVVGHFPFVETMRSIVGNLWVMEKQPGAGDISENEGYQRLSEADVVAITASSLINHTFERIMFHCKPASFKVMLGPSTPLSPVLFDYGLDVIGGALVEDEKAVLSMVEHGAAFRHLKGVRTVVMAKDSLVV